MPQLRTSELRTAFNPGVFQMKKIQDLTPEDFDRLLLWLDPHREQAALKYEKIRVRLVKVYVGRGCGNDADELAARNMDLVAQKLKEGQVPENFVGDKVIYFLGFVNNICHEYFRELARRERVASLFQALVQDDSDGVEELHSYLEKCLNELNEDDHSLVLDYYRFDKKEKIEHRRQLAEQLGIDVKLLRLKVYRIRACLRRCIERCRAQSSIH